jgi:hypothetical protein
MTSDIRDFIDAQFEAAEAGGHDELVPYADDLADIL